MGWDSSTSSNSASTDNPSMSHRVLDVFRSVWDGSKSVEDKSTAAVMPLMRKAIFPRGRTVRCARAVPALCEKLAVLHHREFGKFRRLKGRH